MGIRRPPGEMFDQDRQIVEPLSQRRQRDRERRHPVEQLVIETTLVGELLQILVGGADQAEAVAVVAQHADQLLLHRHRETMEMLEQQRAAAGLLHPSAASSVQTEQAVTDALRGTERAVDAHERAVSRPAGGVEHLGHEPFAGTALPHKKHRRMDGAELLDLLYELPGLGALTDQSLLYLRRLDGRQPRPGGTLGARLPAFHAALQSGDELIDLERLLQIVKSSELQCLDCAVGAGICRHDDDHAVGIVQLELLEKRDAVHRLHVDVSQNDIEFLSLVAHQGLFAIR